MRSLKKNVLSILILISITAFSQNNTKHTLSGYVTEKGSGESLPGVTIFIPSLNTGITTNGYGFYSLSFPTDTFDLVISYVGYKAQLFKIKLTSNVQLDIALENNSQLDEVVVSAKNEERISEDVQMSKIDLPVEQIKDLPALLGEKDVLKAIQLLPGVQKGSEGSSGIYVRGGGPDQNLIIIDEATVYNASHLFGFFSLFNGDALKSVELTKGGFPARYGGRLSSVIDMKMKDGDKEKMKSEIGIGLISSRMTLEGPIKKNKASFLVSGRRTYIDVITRPFIKHLNGNNVPGYYFYDLNAKLNYTINYRNKLYLSGYFGKDKFYQKSKVELENVTDKSETNLNWGNATGTFRWNHLINEKTFANVAVIFSDYKFGIGIKEEINNDRFHLNYSSGIRDYSVKGDMDFFPNTNHSVKAGVVATYHQFRPNAMVTKNSNEADRKSKTQIDAIETAAYIEDDWKITPKWRVNAGFRLSNFNVRTTSYLNPEPRASVRYAITKTLSLKGSYAMMNQYLHLLSNSGFGLPTDLWVPATNKVKPQKAQQIALGIAKDLKIIADLDFLVSLEGYYKKSRHVIGYKDGASFLNVADLDGTGVSSYSYEDIVTTGSAESYGAEFFLQKKAGKLTGWFGYTLSWTWLTFEDLNFGKRFPARYDRRHDISVVGMYKLNDRISLSAVWVYGTGNAITLPTASYQIIDHAAQYKWEDVPAKAIANGYLSKEDESTVVNDHGGKNSFRMAPYHRLDVSIQFHKKRKKYERIFELGLYNAYSRRNPFYYKTETNHKTGTTKLKQISLFPIIPSISWTWKI